MAAKKTAGSQKKRSSAKSPDDGTHDPFHEFARRCAAGEVVLPPAMLPDEERRLHIRATLREDHQFRIENRPDGAQQKFDKLASSPFVFFRGTVLLYYRDYAGTDADLPIVLTIGDVHPENFGVMPNEDGAPFFGIDDFDEAYFAPFTWDVKRGAVGFELCAQENGFSKPQRKKVIRSWVNGYLQGLTDFSRNDREKRHQFRIDNSPPMVRELLEASLKDRREFLAKIVDLEKSRFRPTEEIVPYSKHVDEFQKAIDAYRKKSDLGVTAASHLKVKDVALKKGSGTASLGLDRYWVLIDGPSDESGDDIILELKQARPSALTGLAPHHGFKPPSDAERVVAAKQVHTVGGDPYYGITRLNGHSFVVRERSPFKNEVDMDKLDCSAMQEYARICGAIIAQAHARSDQDTGVLHGDAEQRILALVNPDIFADDIRRFARRAAKRVIQDWKLFKKDHALGAYRFAPSL